jgi:hypothetical protein
MLGGEVCDWEKVIRNCRNGLVGVLGDNKRVRGSSEWFITTLIFFIK